MAKFYTDEHVEFIKKHYAGRTMKDVVPLFNKHFGLNKTEKALSCMLHKRGLNLGSKQNTFKKGSTPKNSRPLYSEKTTPHGVVSVKIPNNKPNAKRKTKWQHKQKFIWEKHNGPVPDGYFVTFRGPDTNNFEPENLMLVSRAELLQLNKNRYRKQPEELKPTVLALSKLQAGISAKRKESANV
jgi:hypothetical protein